MDYATDTAVLENSRGFLQQCKPLVDSISELKWNGNMGLWTVVCRCVLRRQYDALETLVDLVAHGHAHSAIPLLRPACEEFLWLKFLRGIKNETREQIIRAKSQIEIHDTVEAQLSEMRSNGLESLGFRPNFVTRTRELGEVAKNVMRDVSRELGWNLRPRLLFPSVKSIAIMTGEKQLYSVIYHATSRTVHFNIAELLRRAWGTKESLTISSVKMNRYWARFALYWGWGIFALTLSEMVDEFEKNKWTMAGFEDEAELSKLIDEWGQAGKIPIITAEEMNQHLAPGEASFFDLE